MIKELISEWMKTGVQALEGADPSKVEIVPATQPQFGDYQCNVAMQHSKLLKKPPRAIAESILEVLPTSSLIQSVDIQGPGFINIKVTDAYLKEALREQVDSGSYGIAPQSGEPVVIVDYSSPNVAKTMHVAHLRSTIIGDSLKRIYRALGYRVLGDNHIGDWGTQFGKLLVAWKKFRNEGLEDETVGMLEKLYQEFNRRAESDPSLEDEARSELASLQRKEEPNYSLWKKFIDISLKEFERVYSRLGVEFELVRGESFYNEALTSTIQKLQQKNLLQESEGAQVAFLESERFPPFVLQKKDGAYLYSTTDVATIESRVSEFAADRIIYVTDSRQKLHFQQIFAIAEDLGFEVDLKHVMFGLMRFAEGVVMSTRKGEVIPLAELLNQAEEKALAAVESQDYSQEDKDRIAKAVGLGAVKYQDLSQNPASDIVFSWEKALNLQGNSSPYLQYAYARVQGIRRRYVKEFGEPAETCEIQIESDSIRSLVLHLLEYPSVVGRAAETCRPNLIADWLFQLAQQFSGFYNQHSILREQDALKRASRLHLSLVMASHLQHGLSLLGIEVLDRM